MAGWKFEKKKRAQKAREPMQESFFTNASIADDTQALIREGAQNTQDANSDFAGPARIVVTLGNSQDEASSFIEEELWHHIEAEGNGLDSPPDRNEICRCLVFEDFNTSGLTGDIAASDPEDGNCFYFFMRAEGHSGQQEGKRGRHGIGKFVFPKLSRIRTFFTLTIRSDDSEELIAGQSIMRSHKVDDIQYTPDGWWGEFESDGFQMPVNGSKIAKKFRKAFNLTRNSGQNGLSIIVPYIPHDVSINTLSEHCIAEFFQPILNDQLVVELRDLDTGVTINLDAESLYADYTSLLTSDSCSRLSPYIELGNKVVTDDFDLSVDLNPTAEGFAPSWSHDMIDAEQASVLTSMLRQPGRVVRVKVPIYIRHKGSNESELSEYWMYLSRDREERSFRPWFVREGIRITEDKVPYVNGLICLALIQRGALATMIGDSENPAHTEWEKNAVKFRNKYDWGPSTIDFVRRGFTNFLKLLDENDAELDDIILADIFSIEVPTDHEGDRVEPNPIPDVDAGDDVVDPETVETDDWTPSERFYELRKVTGGFSLRGSKNELRSSRRYKVRVAYDLVGATKAKVLKTYHRNDFNLETKLNLEEVSVDGVSTAELHANEIIFEADSKDFKVVVKGFDENRDLLVDVSSEVVS